MISRRRGSGQSAKLASTRAVMSAGVVRCAAVSEELMPAILPHRVRVATGARFAARRVGSRSRMPSASSPTVAARLDRIPPFRMHRRMAVAVGFANFFDLYDIFLGGVLAAVLAETWDLSTNGKALVIASGFAGMFFGAIILGPLADYLGRRRMFLINLMIYSGFSLAAAFSPDLMWLAILRFSPASASARSCRCRTRTSASCCRARSAAATWPPPTRSGSSACRWPRSSARSSSRASTCSSTAGAGCSSSARSAP